MKPVFNPFTAELELDTDMEKNYVPYSGAINNVDLGDKDIETTGLVSGGTGKIGTATDYTEFEPDGTMKAVGDATTYDDLLGDITGVKTSGQGVTLNSTENKLDSVDSADLSDYAYFNYQLSHKWKLGSAVSPHIHYEQANQYTPNFLIQYRWQRQGQIKTTDWTNQKLNTNAFTWTTGRLNQIADGADITPPDGYGQVSDIIQMRLLRDTGNDSGLFDDEDLYTGTVGITSMDLHYQCDTLGSRTEYTK